MRPPQIDMAVEEHIEKHQVQRTAVGRYIDSWTVLKVQKAHEGDLTPLFSSQPETMN